MGPFYGCFMACLWPILWPNWGTVLCPVLWLVCGLFYGLIGDCFRTILWPELGLFWDYFVPCFMACLWLVIWPFGPVLWTLYVSYLALRIKGVII